ncbi:ORF976 [White spot syndrome virus]|uniref:ORF976 n=1 Tax=White spot syndrome virus TaxID=342409 RepID=A0A2D3I780_9VIRU|nr:ORF976 [White spot syndrome virus]
MFSCWTADVVLGNVYYTIPCFIFKYSKRDIFFCLTNRPDTIQARCNVASLVVTFNHSRR